MSAASKETKKENRNIINETSVMAENEAKMNKRRKQISAENQ